MGHISQMPPQENVRGYQAYVRISNTKEDKAKRDKYIVRDLGFRAGDRWDASPKCRLRKTSADFRQMSGSQIPKRIRQNKTSTLSRTWALQPGTDGMHLPNAASGKRPQISGKCPDLKYQRG